MSFNPTIHGMPTSAVQVCLICGCTFTPRFVSSVNCDFCRTPASSFLGLPDSTFYALPPLAFGPQYPQSAVL